MRLGVVGGTGTLGSVLVAELRARGHDVRALSRRPPPGEGPGGHRRVDLTTGEGLVEAVSDAQVIVDAADWKKPGRAMREVLVDGTRRLLRAGEAAGVKLHVLVSIVAIEAIPLPYYRLKLEQEQVLKETSMRTSVLRSTQFHQLVDRVFRRSSALHLLPGGQIKLQPVDARDVARALADGIEEGGWLARREFAGPEVVTLTELARAWTAASGRRSVLVPAPLFGRIGRSLRDGALTAPRAPRGDLNFTDWLCGPGARGPADLLNELSIPRSRF
jgi:uncharacterized protein YbjT (DUF2867 family)